MNNNAHSLRKFDEALASLHTHLLQMSYKAQNALDLAVSSLLRQHKAAANQVIADDEELDTLEMMIDKEAMELLAFFSPVASDMKLVLTSIRLSAMYERMGDEAVTIAKRANKLNKRGTSLREVSRVDPVHREMSDLFRAVNKAVSVWDATALEALSPALEDLRAHAEELTESLTRLGVPHGEELVGTADLIFVSRSLERIANGLLKLAVEIRLMEHFPTADFIP